MGEFRWGVLSTADIGRKAMIPALKNVDDGQVAAVASRDLEKAKKFARQFGLPKAYGNYQQLLDDPDIDMVYIPLPNHLHKEWTVRAAESGKHILCEKPLALNPQEVEVMIAAAQANGVILMESFMYRYHPRFIAALEMVRSGVIGKLKTIESGFTFHLENRNDIRYQYKMGGGALMDVGCYCVNISRLMAGREPTAVIARANWASSDVDQQMVALMDFGDGLFAHFDCGFNQAIRQQCLLAGTKDTLLLPEVFNPGRKRTIIQKMEKGNTADIYSFTGVDAYSRIATAFMQTVAGDEPDYPISDSINNMRVITALLESARNKGRVVYLTS